MSKIKNSGLGQYGKVYSVNRIGGERINITQINVKKKLQFIQTLTATCSE